MESILRSSADRKALQQFRAVVRTVRWALRRPTARRRAARAAIQSVRAVQLRALLRWGAETAFLAGDAVKAGHLDALADWCGEHGQKINALIHALFDPPRWVIVSEGSPDVAAFLDALFSPADRQALLCGGAA